MLCGLIKEPSCIICDLLYINDMMLFSVNLDVCVTNLRYADNIILLATSNAELQKLVDRLDRVSRKYSLLINVVQIGSLNFGGV